MLLKTPVETLTEIGLSLLLTYSVIVVAAGVTLSAIIHPVYAVALLTAGVAIIVYGYFRKL